MRSHEHAKDDVDRTEAELALPEVCRDTDDSIRDAASVRCKRDCSECPLAHLCQFTDKKAQDVVRRTSSQTDVAKDGPSVNRSPERATNVMLEQTATHIAEGHREAASRVLDGREHDGTLAAEGRQL